MARRRYTQAQKDQALGALGASAHLVDGEWAPMFSAVSKAMDIPLQTLHGWWRKLSAEEREGRLAEASSRAREENWRLGGEDFLQWFTDRYRSLVEYMLHPDHYSHERVPLHPANPTVVQLAGVPVQHAVKVSDHLLDRHADIRRVLLGETSEKGTNPLAAAREAAQRTRLMDTLRAQSTHPPEPEAP